MEEARNDKLAEKVLSYQETKDERLAAEILKEMRPLLLSICQKFYIRGMDREDLYEDNEKQTLADGIEDKCKPKPGDELIILDDARKCQSVLQRILPAYPLRVFEERAEGKSYAMIAEELGRKKKSIDNAIDRAIWI